LTGGPWSDEGISCATARPAGLRRPAPPRVPRRVRGRGVSAPGSVAAAGAGSGSGSAAGSSAAGSASVVVDAGRERERPAPPRVPRRVRGRGESADASSATGDASAGAGVVASASADAAVVRLARPPRRLGASSAAVSSAGALADAALPPCRDRFRKDSHSEIMRSPQGNFVRCIAQRFSLLQP
jgi:hypothetical protein